jgi:hypothetical protein
MKYNFEYLVTKGHHLILILACNWLHYVDKNFVFQNMEISSHKMVFYIKKINLNNVYKLNVIMAIMIDVDKVCITISFKSFTKLS